MTNVIADHISLTDEERAQRSGPVITKVATFDEARTRAMDRVMGGNAVMLPCMIFRQGERMMVSLVLPLGLLQRHLSFDATPKGGDVRQHLNRTLMPDHVSVIKDYLEANHSRYILPAMTLNSAANVELFQIGEALGGVAAGFLILSATTRFAAVDGQHRGAAIVGYKRGDRTVPGALAELPDMGSDGIAVQLTLEDDLVQLHQDFADAGRTKPIAANMLAAYDMRQPINQLLGQVIDRSPLLQGRIDNTSKTLSARAQAVFLLSSVRGLLKVFLLGSNRAGEAQFEKEVVQRFKQPGAQQNVVDNVARLMKTLTEEMAPWNEIAPLKPGHGESNVVPELREKYVNLTMTGLTVIGIVGFHASKKSPAEQVEIYKKLAAIDWRRDNPDWLATGLIKQLPVPKRGRTTDVTRSRTDIEATAAFVMERCGLE